MAHITGGGLTENVPRTMPEGRSPRIDRGSLDRAPVVHVAAARRRCFGRRGVFRAFNMGVGLVVVCSSEYEFSVLSALKASGEAAWRLGEVVERVTFSNRFGTASSPSRVVLT